MIVRDDDWFAFIAAVMRTMTELILRSGKTNPSFGLSVKQDDWP